ncbi:hypothetical protein ES703_27332 [subsurface metagenome]
MANKHTFDFAEFRTRLYNAAKPPEKKRRKAQEKDVKEKVVEKAIAEIKRIVGVSSVKIVTVRERSGFREERLRHVYASHTEIRNWFDDTDREWFDKRFDETKDNISGLESSAFKDPRATRIPPVSFDGPTCHCAVFHMSGLEVIREIKSRGQVRASHIFPERIENFLSYIAQLEFKKPISFDKINACLVFGITKTHRTKQIVQMVAIYVGPPKNQELWEDGRLSNRIRDCAHIVAEMFRTVGEIQVRERLELERRALSDIVGLVPTFADEDVSPSDAVAELLPKFDSIFEGHGHVGTDCYQHKPGDTSHEWVTFLSIGYREPDKMDEPPAPVLSVYPQIKARDNYLQSYRVSRFDTLSISKYLLHSFLNSQDIATSVEFKQQFDNIKKVPEKAFYRDNGVPVGLILTKRDRAWDDLQFDIFGQHTRTTAAFLLRRSTGDDKKPFAILVFESDHPDAFSHDDIELLSRLVDATASLHSDIKIGSHSIDYSALCKEAFTDIVPGDVGDVPYWQIAFELSRFDHHAAQQILSCDDDTAKKVWKDPDALQRKTYVTSCWILYRILTV